MEEKPEGTPNPLNPNIESAALDANPSEPMMPVDSTTMEEAIKPTPDVEVPTENVETSSEPITEPISPVRQAPVEHMGIPRPANPARPVDPMIPVRPAAARPVDPMIPVRPTAGPVLEPEPMTTEASPAPMADIMQPTAPQPTQPVQPMVAAQPVQNMGVVTNMDGTVPAQGMADPLSRPMQKAVEQLPPKPKKKKTGLIIGMLVSLFLAIGCGVAAALIFANSNKPDPVAVAVNKIISGGAPENVAIDGTIDINVNDMSSPFADVKILLKSEAVTKSRINSSTATLNANLRNGESFSIELGEVYAANGDLYLRVDGITNVLENPYIFDTAPTAAAGEEVAVEEDELYLETNCGTEENCIPSSTTSESAAMESLAAMMELFETVDGEWIRISTDSLSSVIPGMTTTESDLSCLTNLMRGTNSNSLAGMYDKNQFITSTTENLRVVSEKNPIYRVTFNSEKFKNFLDEARGSTAMESLASCTGGAEIDADKAVASLNKWPEIYVEINGSDDFTRLYLVAELNEGDASLVADLNFSYPANVNVPEPVEYTDIEAMMQEIVLKMYELQGATEGVEVVEELPMNAETE